MDSPGRTDASSGSGVPSRRVLLGVDHATTQPRLVRIRVELRATDRLRSQPSSTSVRRWNLLQMPSSPRRVLRGLHRLFDPLTLTPATGRECGERAVDGEEPEPATFGLGRFCGPDARFGAMDGVIRTRAGYAGGTKRDPSYHSLGDHTEVVHVEFDPTVITYRGLVAAAFRQRNPRTRAGKTQYQNVVFAATPGQRTVLEEFLTATGRTADDIETRIEQLSRFSVAEDSDQKYKLRSAPSVMTAFEDAGYTDADIRDSPIAAKLNGYVAGHDVDIPAELTEVHGETLAG